MRPKPLSKDDILKAMRHTRSNRAAAFYLACSYQHYKPYAKMYVDEKTGISLFDLHKNQCGKGIPKHLGTKRHPALDLILSGQLDPSHFTPEKIKARLIHESRIAEECAICGFHERRVLDYKIPLLLNFTDGNKRNYKLENLRLLCYNCYFLRVGDVFTLEQINVIEDHRQERYVEKPEWDLGNDDLDNMRQLGIL